MNVSRKFIRAPLLALFLVGAAALVQGCVYDPYTGTYVPCCAYPAYGYGYYGYPGYYGGVAVAGGWGWWGRGGWGWHRPWG